jgi:hypothetical protein
MASPEPTPFDGVALPVEPEETAPSTAEPDPETMVDCIRRFIRVQARLKEIDAEEKALKREERELSDQVIDMMIEEGMDSPPGVDGMTAYISPVVFVKKNINPDTGEEYTSEDIYQALRDSGLSSMIRETYNGNQMRSLMREYDEHGTEPPKALGKVLTLDKRRELRITPMAARKRAGAPRQ